MRKMAAIRRSRRQNRSPQASMRSPTIESWASPTPVQVAPPCSTGHAVPLLSDGSVCTQTSRSWQSRLRVPPTHDDDKMPQLTRAVADGTFALAVMQESWCYLRVPCPRSGARVLALGSNARG
jgi:hypothetical protein